MNSPLPLYASCIVSPLPPEVIKAHIASWVLHQNLGGRYSEEAAKLGMTVDTWNVATIASAVLMFNHIQSSSSLGEITIAVHSGNGSNCINPNACMQYYFEKFIEFLPESARISFAACNEQEITPGDLYNQAWWTYHQAGNQKVCFICLDPYAPRLRKIIGSLRNDVSPIVFETIQVLNDNFLTEEIKKRPTLIPWIDITSNQYRHLCAREAILSKFDPIILNELNRIFKLIL